MAEIDSQPAIHLQAPANSEDGAATLRVNVDDLDESETATLYEDAPFTGIAVETHSQGHIVAETEYRNGLKLGRERTYYPNRQVESERNFSPWGLDGDVREWRPDGTLKSEASYEFGIQVSKKEWNEAGDLVRETHIPESSPQHARLQKLRLSRTAKTG